MRPASEIHSALDLISAELERPIDPAAIKTKDDALSVVRRTANLSIARDVLAWVAGGHWTDLTDGANPWLVAFLLDDPPQLDSTPPSVN